ncbi:MAG: F0F1 ATP synthase subunit epsilon [Proteobacteria bacterium]|nr:F0F1 ATP synthase subunit epsilon [Pseudomonadota bacterium]
MPATTATPTTAFELVTPEKILLELPARMVVMPGSLGRFGVLPRHTPMLVNLQFGVVDIYGDKATGNATSGKPSQKVLIDDGIVDVTHDKCLLLASRAEVLDKSRTGEIKQKRDSAKRRGNDQDVAFLEKVLEAI